MRTPRRVGAAAAAVILGIPAVAAAQWEDDSPLLPPLDAFTPKAARVIATVRPLETNGGAVTGDVCPPEQQTYADSDFAGTFVGTLPPGMVETEIAAVTFTVDPGKFPLLLDSTEIIFAQTHFNATTTAYTYMVWEGQPNNGTLIASFSSDGTILPHVQLPVGGAQAVNLTLTVDPGDPEQIVIMDDGSHKFSVGIRIDAHNSPPSSDCSDGICSLPAVCCPPNQFQNAWPAMDNGGPDVPASNWLMTRDCPGAFSFCFVGPGWFNFSSPLIPAQYVNDWAIRVNYTPLTCGPGAGACCFGDGSCTIEIEGDCTSQGGAFIGDGVSCGEAQCADQTGACCFDDGGCSDDAPLDGCLGAGGTFQGAGTTCAGVECDPDGACCIPATQGCVNLTNSQCAVAGGIWSGGFTDCASTVCFAPCCLPDGSCVDDSNQADCDALGGTFQSGGDCAGTSCPQPTGACCLPAGCLELTEADCVIVAGTWSGMATDCTDSDGGGVADACENCPGDFDMDGQIGFTDLLAVLSNWGPCVDCPQDLDDDDVVGFTDLLQILSNWGPCA